MSSRNAILVAAGSLLYWVMDVLLRSSSLYRLGGGELVDLQALALLPFVIGVTLAVLSDNNRRWANGLMSFALYYVLMCGYYAYSSPSGAEFSVKFPNYALQLISYMGLAGSCALAGGISASIIQRLSGAKRSGHE